MKAPFYLLDTQVFLWLANDDKRLSKKAKIILDSNDSHLVISTASIWEMAIKYNIGKLQLHVSFEDFIKKSLTSGIIGVLDINRYHAAKISSLENHHNDPFDRLLVAQALVEEVPIISSDKILKKYNIDVIW